MSETRESSFSRQNGFNFLRLCFAVMVIVAHARPLGGFGPGFVSSLSENQIDLGGLGVLGFFAISGYLVTQSAVRSNGVQFIWKRFLRLFPAYWALLVFSAFVFGPLAWVLEGKELQRYWGFAPEGPFGYIFKNFTTQIGTWGIYDLFTSTTPWGLATGISPLNGSLWTLFWEVSCYIALAIFIIFGVLQKAKWVMILIAGLLLITNLVGASQPEIYGNLFPIFFENQDAVKFCLAFFVGGAFSFRKDLIQIDWKIIIFLGLIVLASFRGGGFLSIGVVAYALLVIGVGEQLPHFFRKIASKNDFSYGLYLYGFPIQMLLALGNVQSFGYVAYTFISLAATLPMAFFSWHLIERPVQRLKNWGPGKSVGSALASHSISRE